MYYLISKINENFFLILLFSILGSCAAYFMSKKLTPWYEYSLLIRSPTFQIPAGDALSAQETLINKSSKNEISGFLKFSYFENPRYQNISNQRAYLKSLDTKGESDFLELTCWGKSLEEAQYFCREVFQGISNLFLDRVEEALRRKKKALDSINSTLDIFKRQLREVETGLRKFGTQPSLVSERSSLLAKILKAEKDKVTFENKTQEAIRPVSIASNRDLANPDPVYPNFYISILLGGIAGFLVGLVISWIQDF